MEVYLPLFILMISLSGVLPYCGQVGVTKCIRVSTYYYQYQWATCLTNTYIKVKSNGNHKCRDSTATYCYYQCMLESFNQESGFVNSGCSCKPGDEYEEQDLELPSKCYSPSGTSCGWYSDCLKKKYPCTGTGDDYALNYVTKLCNFYDKYHSRFSQEGQEWIDSVRKCLQVALVPIIRPYSHLSCARVKRFSLTSHAQCYIQPDGQKKNITICNLGLEDFWRILFTIKSGMAATFESDLEAMTKLFDKRIDCDGTAGRLLFANNDTIRNLKMKVMYKKGSVDDVSDRKIANYIANHIATQLGWDSQGVTWFTYVVSSSYSELDFNIFLADSSYYDLNAEGLPGMNLTMVVDDLQKEVLKGRISASEPLKFRTVSLSVCLDINCYDVINSYEVTTEFIAPINSEVTTEFIAPINSKAATEFIAPINSKAAIYSKRQILGQLLLCFLFFQGLRYL